MIILCCLLTFLCKFNAPSDPELAQIKEGRAIPDAQALAM
jgi:hypothetical protein